MRPKRFPLYRSHTRSWNAWSGQSGESISTRHRFGMHAISNENWIRSRNITTVIGCIRGLRNKYPTRELAAKTSQQSALITTAGNLTAAAYFNYQWRLELEFAPHRFLVRDPAHDYLDFEPGVALDQLIGASIHYRIAIGASSHASRTPTSSPRSSSTFGYEMRPNRHNREHHHCALSIATPQARTGSSRERPLDALL